jgi:flagellar biosynthesis/type III secretory pathway protein FliH
MSPGPERYAFPKATRLDEQLRAEPDRSNSEAAENAVRQALERGYTDGLSQGRAAAELAAKDIFEDARRQGFCAGRNEGLAQTEEAAAILRQALAQFNEWRADLVNEAETFCVDLVLAGLARLLEVNEVHTDFVKRTVQRAIKVLAPDLPQSILVNPGNFRLVASAFPTLQVRAEHSIPPGGVRIEGGRLLVDGSVQHAFEQIKSAMLETRARRVGEKRTSKRELASQSASDKRPALKGTD